MPALAVTGLLFGGGLLLAAVQSVGLLGDDGSSRLTLAAYRTLLTDTAFWRSLGLSLWLAGAATLLAAGLGTGLALALRHTAARSPLRWLLGATLPLPHVVAALVTVHLLSQGGLASRLTHAAGLTASPADFPALVFDPLALGVLLELAAKETPFVAVVALAALARLDPRLEEAARSLGAGRPARLRAVVWPAVRPAVTAASLLVFAFAFGVYEVPLLLGPTAPAPLSVTAYRLYTDPDLARRPLGLAASLLLALVSSGLLFAYLRAGRGRR
ncbi:ABC transporter permease subunit [Deinococcus sp. YIM 134068]|uniref:ABC transporter permease subunit n=1 Tax=Deinococcus lichenicola TaxID=3118910 RepID=UPI002F939FDF